MDGYYKNSMTMKLFFWLLQHLQFFCDLFFNVDSLLTSDGLSLNVGNLSLVNELKRMWYICVIISVMKVSMFSFFFALAS